MPTEAERMVREQIERRGVLHARVLEAMRHTAREPFVPAAFRAQAYDDAPIAIGHAQTISQPYMVAVMTELLDPQPHERVLEIGTGSGYQAAILSQLSAHVDTLEIVPRLEYEARERLQALGYTNIAVHGGNGWDGLAEYAPYDKILLTAAPRRVPETLVDQLAPGGRLVAPVGEEDQRLLVIERAADGALHERWAFGVLFVPMVGGPL